MAVFLRSLASDYKINLPHKISLIQILSFNYKLLIKYFISDLEIIITLSNLKWCDKVGRHLFKTLFYFSHFSEKFSTKIWLINQGEYFWKSLSHQQKSLAIGDRASVFLFF